ncbi:unnamed protein product [Vicia faba]|uniref:PGG domain-containing protein n=1 Tax=Vicia faba TaxID=3906 RepID=A0AAV1AE75_VICFA|nr:unnamed protein product [Vicia faba]
MNTNSGDQLNAAAQTDDIDLLYTVIHDDPWILEIIDSIPFVETPLHIAASLGHIRFAIEIINLKPSFVWKLQFTNAATFAHKLKSKPSIRHKVTTCILRITSNILEEQRNTWLIVATLVATATYQSALSPPGGIYQASAGNDNNLNITSANSTLLTPNNAGESVLSGPEFCMFLILNMTSFFF